MTIGSASEPAPFEEITDGPATRAAAPGAKKKDIPLLPPEEVAPPAEIILTRREKLALAIGNFSKKIPLAGIFHTPPITEDIVDENREVGRADQAIKKITRLSIAIAVFGSLLAFGAPFFAPIYVYHSQTPEGKTALLVPLDMPNLTDPAIVSWAATSVTEILSFGFGDIEAKTAQQKLRFTPLGWKAFVKAFLGTKVIDTFKRNQMVMTTVPSDTPVILSKGINEDDVYQWKVEVPIITTYAANNNVMKPERGTIQITIVRVSHDQSPSGIAIDILRQIKH